MNKLFEAKHYTKQLLKTALFQGVSSQVLGKWLSGSGAAVQAYAAGDLILSKGEKAHRLGILLRGRCECEREFSDGRMHMSSLGRNDMFGMVQLFGGEEGFVLNITAAEPCRILFITEEQMLELFRKEEKVLLNYLGYINSRIRFLNRRLDALSKDTVSGRLYSLLATEAEDGIYAVHSYTLLAETLCVSRATLYRALDTLCAEGKILRDKKKIIVLEETL